MHFTEANDGDKRKLKTFLGVLYRYFGFALFHSIASGRQSITDGKGMGEKGVSAICIFCFFSFLHFKPAE